MSDKPSWEPWNLDSFHGETIGGHSYCLHSNATMDHKRKAEKAFFAIGRCQVVHHHPEGQDCHDRCEVFGVGCPKEFVPRNGEI